MLKAPKYNPTIAKNAAILAFLLIALAFVFYSYRFIRLTSFEIDGQPYYALFDDAMISMQYARNLASGQGLVWNAGGERVEGFSNPLWVGFMAVFHLFSLPSSQISLAIQISGVIFLLANLFLVWKIAQEYFEGHLAPVLAVFLTAFYFHLNNWALQGMEVGLLALLLTASVWLALRAGKGKRFSMWPYALLAIGTWVRIDMVVPLIVLTAFFARQDRKYRQKHLIWGFGLLAGSLIVQTGLRLWYYGEWLPNTYYLKVVGIPLMDRIQRGLEVLGGFVWGSGWFLIVLPLLLVAVWPDASTLLFLALFIGQIAYSVFVGGDAWEHKGGANRFIALAMPLFFLLFVQTLDKVRRTLFTPKINFWARALSHVVLAGFVLTSLFSFNVINENDPIDKWATLKRPIFVAGTQRYVTLGLLINEITDEDAKVAVVTAGNIVYFAERTGIDMLGKSDKVIARSQPHQRGGSFDNVDEIFRPGHNKWDYQHSIVNLQPDVIAQIWGSSTEMQPYMDQVGYNVFTIDGFSFFIKLNSDHILWDVVNDRVTE